VRYEGGLFQFAVWRDMGAMNYANVSVASIYNKSGILLQLEDDLYVSLYAFAVYVVVLLSPLNVYWTLCH
jgi:hypothetical protein